MSPHRETIKFKNFHKIKAKICLDNDYQDTAGNLACNSFNYVEKSKIQMIPFNKSVILHYRTHFYL